MKHWSNVKHAAWQRSLWLLAVAMLTPRQSQPPAVRAGRMFAGTDSWEGDTKGRGGTKKQLTDTAARKQVVDNIKPRLYSNDSSVSELC